MDAGWICNNRRESGKKLAKGKAAGGASARGAGGDQDTDWNEGSGGRRGRRTETGPGGAVTASTGRPFRRCSFRRMSGKGL